MKLFEMEGFLRGKCIPRDLKVNETNAEYLVRKFAEADAMCAALAAENAGLKDAISSHAAGFTVCEACGEENISGNDDVCRALNETPATDAFLAEVLAQGVEMFAAHKRERQQALRSRSMRMSEEAAGMAADAENFADELRKGVQS
ncbi:Uncharacterised protein [Enterobacter hormaechei]|uniref:hypothetical protein n=2 Tax=Bacteria TaxID=2 RepID=UPI000791AA25|nr:hypothetical protein [Enterobacter hormaechei]HDW0968792.1 hypothetical protein [Enterobacter hormaechei subsp. xiangfangensis]MDK7079352.1 hypothetical protein [Enterobacter hormaechei]MDK7107913.1 hypothetical protein [Enterobacter hormaechei]MDK7619519.1 hypothetical protein [Enterobacter hormaechei]MDK7864961.1 hypothetical protein [Enterobacter hormaechei]